MPLSTDPDLRARQLANLRQGVTIAPEGNVRALKSGAWSTVAIEPFRQLWAQEFFDQIAEDSPLREDRAFRHWVATASKVFARLQSAGSWLDTRMGDFGNSDVLRAIDAESKLRREATDVLERLKLAPLAPSDDLRLQEYVDNILERLAAAEARAGGTARAGGVVVSSPPAIAIPDSDIEEVPDAAEGE